MKIKISHISNTYNNGSFMMAINTIYYLAKKFKTNIEFNTDTPNDKNLVRLQSAFDNIKVSGREGERKLFNNTNNGIKPIKMLKLYINKLYQIKTDDSHVHIVLGGDDLSEYYGNGYLVYGLLNVYLYSLKMPVFLIGQTIGPFTGWRKSLAGWVLKSSNIYTREKLNCQYLKDELGLKNVTESRDLAFLDLPGQNDISVKNNILDKYGLVENQYITIVPSGLVEHYSKDKESYIRNFAVLIKHLLKDNDNNGRKIVLLAHVINTGGDDRHVISDIVNELGEYGKSVISVIEDLMPLDLRLILGNGYYTITGRMHAAVSTFQMGKPAISLSYSIKYNGVISDGLGMGQLVIDCANSLKWEKNKVTDEIVSCINYIEENYSDIQEIINLKVEESKLHVEKQIHEIGEALYHKDKSHYKGIS